jgi:hypothetical protein
MAVGRMFVHERFDESAKANVSVNKGKLLIKRNFVKNNNIFLLFINLP